MKSGNKYSKACPHELKGKPASHFISVPQKKSTIAASSYPAYLVAQDDNRFLALKPGNNLFCFDMIGYQHILGYENETITRSS